MTTTSNLVPVNRAAFFDIDSGPMSFLFPAENSAMVAARPGNTETDQADTEPKIFGPGEEQKSAQLTKFGHPVINFIISDTDGNYVYRAPKTDDSYHAGKAKDANNTDDASNADIKVTNDDSAVPFNATAARSVFDVDSSTYRHHGYDAGNDEYGRNVVVNNNDGNGNGNDRDNGKVEEDNCF